jgi:hypothetical protein
MTQQELIFGSEKEISTKVFKEYKMVYTKEENDAYQAAKKERNFIERQDRKKRKKGLLFHRSSKAGPYGKPVGVTFTGKCDQDKVAKLEKRKR